MGVQVVGIGEGGSKLLVVESGEAGTGCDARPAPAPSSVEGRTSMREELSCLCCW